MSRQPTTMSEKKRAFDALQGITYPSVWQRGRWTGIRDGGQMGSAVAVVEVVRISVTGKTIWTRFVSPHASRRYGAGPHRWQRWEPTEPLYFSGSVGKRSGPGGGDEIYGEVRFDAVRT